MGSDAVGLLREALGLSERDRADIAAELLASLPEPDDDVDADAWLADIEDRARRIRSGETVCEDWDTVEQRLLAKYPEA